MTAGSRVDHEPRRFEGRAKRDPAGVRENILDVATTEFAEHGLAAASVNRIAEATATTKRMLYYYFGSKESLYLAVLERCYGMMAARVSAGVQHSDDALADLRHLAEQTFDFHETHRDYVRLVVGENMLRGTYMARSTTLPQQWKPVLDEIETILETGRRAGVVRDNVTAVDVQILINSFSLFRIANHYTFDILYDTALASAPIRGHLRELIGDLTVRTVTR